MDFFVQQLLSGAATGLVYASLALALVLVFRGTGILNFAQGELAAVSTLVPIGRYCKSACQSVDHRAAGCRRLA